jgi:hypothetical protein
VRVRHAAGQEYEPAGANTHLPITALVDVLPRKDQAELVLPLVDVSRGIEAAPARR